jgi:hypothetical protein
LVILFIDATLASQISDHLTQNSWEMEIKDGLNLENGIWPKFPPPNILLKFKINKKIPFK